MHQKTRAAVMAASILGAGLIGSMSRAVTIDFETPVIPGAFAETSGDAFAGQGVRFSTVRLSGTVAVGSVVTLAAVNGDLRIYRDATAISGEQLAGPALGGASNDLLMRFDRPLASLALTSDDAVETANTIRLMALAPTAETDRYTILALAEGLDDAVSAPANLLAVAPSETFSIALFEIRNQQEGFDDLTFAFAEAGTGGGSGGTGGGGSGGSGSGGGSDIVVDPPPPDVVTAVSEPASLAMFAGMLGAATATRRARRTSAGPRRG